MTLDDTRQKMEDWRIDYNEVFAHNAIRSKPLISLMNGSGTSSALRPPFGKYLSWVALKGENIIKIKNSLKKIEERRGSRQNHDI